VTVPGRHPIQRIVGREAELARGDQFLAAMADGPAILLLEGEPGIGKTTVWTELCERAAARGYTVLSARPVQSETELAFAGLIDLIGGIADRYLPTLPAPQRAALEIALLLVDAPEKEARALAVSAGFLAIVTRMAAETPVLIAIDDLQWLDSPTSAVLRFAARRLRDVDAGIVASIRVPSAIDPSVSRPDLAVDADRVRIGRLPMGSLYHVIHDHLGLSLPRSALANIDTASAGNPFFALEMARAVAAGGAIEGRTLGAHAASMIPETLLTLVAARLDSLPPATRDALLKASALARPTTQTVPAEELDPAVTAGVVAIDPDGCVRFAHPLLSNAVYGAASPARRAATHRALAAEVTDPDEGVLHAALASAGRDEAIAARLHESAERARRRGAPDHAAQLEERAADRTPSDLVGVALERRLRAAEHHERAGNIDRARAMATGILASAPAPRVRSRTLELLAEMAYGRSFPEAAALLEEALSTADDAARRAHLELNVAFALIGMADMPGAIPHARRAEDLARAVGDPSLLAEALSVRVQAEALMTGRVDQVALRLALELEGSRPEMTVQTRPSLTAALIDLLCGRLDDARDVFLDLRTALLDSGEEHELPFVLNLAAFIEVWRGEIGAATDLVDEAHRTATVIGSETMRAHALAVRALIDAAAGNDDQAAARAGEAIAISQRVGWRVGTFYAAKALSFLALSRGDHASVQRVLRPVGASIGTAFGFGISSCVSGDLIEALIMAGDLDEASRLANGLEMAGAEIDAPWALVIGARGRALLESLRGNRDAALEAIETALAHGARLPIPYERALTLLAKGRILRRARQKRSARDELLAARDIFEGLGMRHWVARADEELSRIGLRRVSPGSLSETEQTVAELAASGLTNRQIAAQAFLSPKTVEDVLERVYGKLAIRSRAELGARMGPRADDRAGTAAEGRSRG
jgi:DNA-binding NarL/FixJ family response regulator